MADEAEIKVNRAPVLTLWAAVVAERLGHDADAAITLGRAVAGSSARIKARAIGLAEDAPKEGHDAPPPRPAPREVVRLLGRDVPVTEGREGLRALDGGHAAASGPARAYVERALGAHLPAVRRAMEALADSLPPAELNRIGFRMYEHFRPAVPPGARGWGARGVLDLGRIREAAG